MPEETRPTEGALLRRIRQRLPELVAILAEVSSHWGYEDLVYRFYHQSFKVYHLQAATLRVVETLRSLAPDRPLDPWFPARYFLEMACRYGRTLETPPEVLPSGWAALLCSYSLR